jgi:hypothetical protein
VRKVKKKSKSETTRMRRRLSLVAGAADSLFADLDGTMEVSPTRLFFVPPPSAVLLRHKLLSLTQRRALILPSTCHCRARIIV